MAWQPPSITAKWGAFFAPDPTEQKAIVDMIVAAMSGKGGPLITRRMAIEKLAPIFGIENVDAALEQVEKEAEESAKRELDAATAALGKGGGAAGFGKDPGGKAPAPGGGSGRPASGKDDAR